MTGREATPVERIADALFAYNTAEGRHFVIHDGGYEGIAQVALDAMTEGREASKRAACFLCDADWTPLREGQGGVMACVLSDACDDRRDRKTAGREAVPHEFKGWIGSQNCADCGKPPSGHPLSPPARETTL